MNKPSQDKSEKNLHSQNGVFMTNGIFPAFLEELFHITL